MPQLKLKPTLQVSLYGCSSHQYQHSTYIYIYISLLIKAFLLLKVSMEQESSITISVNWYPISVNILRLAIEEDPKITCRNRSNSKSNAEIRWLKSFSRRRKTLNWGGRSDSIFSSGSRPVAHSSEEMRNDRFCFSNLCLFN